MSESKGESPEKTAHNQSVLKAVALIRCFVDTPDGVTLSDLSRRTSTHVSTAYRILQTLVAGGILRRDEGSERYFPGTVLLALAGSTFSAAGLGPASEVLRELSRQTGESASLGIRDGGCVVVLLSSESSHALRFGHQAGARLALHVSAMGRVMLAFGPDPIHAAVKELGLLEPWTKRTPTTPSELEQALATVVEHGYALVDEEQHVGVRSIGVPVFGSRASVQAAISVQGPVSRLTADRYDDVLATLRRAAEVVSKLPSLDRFAPR